MKVLIDSPDSLLVSFLSGTGPGQLILVTGNKGSGKTRWCLALAQAAASRGIPRSGLVSPAVFEGNLKIGIDLRDLKTGMQRPLAVHRGESSQGQLTQEWHFNDETLKWGNAILAQSGDCPLIILDELGPLELQRDAGLTNGIRLVSARRYQLACVVIRTSLLAQVVEYWPWAQIFKVPLQAPDGSEIH